MEGDLAAAGGGEDGGAGETLAAALRKPARKGVKDQWIVGATNDKGQVNYRCCTW